MSNSGSRRAVNGVKGNHRRTCMLAGMQRGGWENISATPSQEEALLLTGCK
jgi:hypothetical protein